MKAARRGRMSSDSKPKQGFVKGIKHSDIPLEELKAILQKAKSSPLDEADLKKLNGAVDTLAVVTTELELKGVSISRLRKLIFGASTEKTRNIFKDNKLGRTTNKTDKLDTDRNSNAKKKQDKPKPKGHGRLAASAYQGAEKVEIKHQKLKPGDNCPECLKGKLYTQNAPAQLVRISGMAPINATVYELERLRCNLCGEIFTASSPDTVGEEKYDNSAAAMLALLKYGYGLPFNRLMQLESNLKIPLPSSTQWDVVNKLASDIMPAYRELIRQAAGGDVLYNDDTTIKIVALMKENYLQQTPNTTGGKGKMRKGMFCTGIVSTKNKRKIAVFFSGHKHAGENLAHVLSQRSEELKAPIQMSDALAANTAGEFTTIVSNCNSHARRKFVEVADNFPEEVRYVLEIFKIIYTNDSEAKAQKLSADERLEFHREFSKPKMDDLKKWFKVQFAEKRIEPNSSLGQAIKYMQKHWDELTLFLRVAGAPLDNNICERAIKKAILQRKNSLFFKTEKGAKVSDLFMSLIHSAELAKVNPFDYLIKLAEHKESINKNPEQWMPWNYTKNLTKKN